MTKSNTRLGKLILRDGLKLKEGELATYEKLQQGPLAYKQACGKPGVNGGFFDNPDLRFGVNCYGVRPDKKATDELLSESGAALPPTPEEIDFDRKVQKFRDQLDTMIVLPWNKGNWAS